MFCQTLPYPPLIKCQVPVVQSGLPQSIKLGNRETCLALGKEEGARRDQSSCFSAIGNSSTLKFVKMH